MATGKRGFAGRIIRSFLWMSLAGLPLLMGGCASIIAHMVPPQRVKLEDYIACDKNRPATSDVTEELCEKVNDLIQTEVGLPEAGVGFDVQGTGRLQLAGKFKNEDEVEKAFAIAQSVVGSEFVSPVTPGHIKVEDWQQCLNQKFAGLACEEVGDEAYSLDKKPPGRVRAKYALLVGIGHFKNLPGNDLPFADKDANAIAEYLTNPRLGGFLRENVKVLTNENATRPAILNEMTKLEQRAKRDDVVVVYFSSHGTQPTAQNHVNIVTYDTEAPPAKTWIEKITQRRTLWKNSISRQNLHDFFRRIESKRVLMILDVCFSGDVFADIPGFLSSESEAMARNEKSYVTGFSARELMQIFGAKDLIVEDQQGQAVDASRHPFSKREKRTVGLNAKISRNPLKSWGKVIISASNSDEQSWGPSPNERDTINSYFTHFFLDSLARHHGNIEDSFLSAIPLVNDTVQERKGKTQKPQYFSIPAIDAWNFSLNGHTRR